MRGWERATEAPGRGASSVGQAPARRLAPPAGWGWGNEPTFPFTHTLCWGGGAGVTAPLHMHFTRKVFQIR